MRIATCPTASIRAPVAAVWQLLTDPSTFKEWSGAALVSASPPGRVVAGQRIELAARAGFARFRVVFDMYEVDDVAHHITVDVHLPLGIINHEVITCASLSPRETFVSFG